MWNHVFPEPQKFFDWLKSIKNWNTFEGWAAKVIIVLVVGGGVLWFVRYFFEVLAKIKESWKALGFPVTLSPEKRLEIRRRQQFCSVMRGDVALLNKAENWNDQFFTDLEAEVEAEGGYYSSALHRLVGRQSHGLRRV